MRGNLSLAVVGNATSVFIAISFIICVSFDLLLPQHAMFEVWRGLLPGFEWLSWSSFGLGLVESYAYGWYIAVIWVPLYNVFAGRKHSDQADAG